MSEEATLDEFVKGEEEHTTQKGDEQHLPEIDEIPSDWSLVTVEDIANDLIGGGTPLKSNEEYWGGEIPWASVKDLNGIELAETEDYITEAGVENSATNLIPEDSIVISTRMTVGEPFLNTTKMAINQDMKAIIPETENANPLFLVYSLWDKDPYLKSLGRGTTVDGITTNDLALTHLGLPSLSEQRKIATVLYTIDRAIEKTESAIDHYEKLQTGLLRKHFGKASVQADYSEDRETKRLGPKSYTVPKSWDTVQIADVSEVVTGDTPSTKNEEYYGGDLPFVTPEDFGETKRVHRGSRGLTSKGRQKARPIPEGSVMMDCIGMDMGKVRIAGRELATNQQINSVVVSVEKMLPEFLYFHLKAISNLIQSQAGQTRTPIVSKSQFSSFEIFKPPISAQEDVVNSLSVFDDLIEKESEYAAQLRRIKRGLMQDLLSGTVRTTNTNIEVPEEIAQYG